MTNRELLGVAVGVGVGEGVGEKLLLEVEGEIGKTELLVIRLGVASTMDEVGSTDRSSSNVRVVLMVRSCAAPEDEFWAQIERARRTDTNNVRCAIMYDQVEREYECTVPCDAHSLCLSRLTAPFAARGVTKDDHRNVQRNAK